MSLVGCTTTISYRALDLDKSPFSSLKGKSVAVVVETDRMPNEVSTRSEAETFVFKGMANVVRDALKAQAEVSAAKVEVVESMPKTGYDYYLKPQLDVRSVYDFWTFGCLVAYKLEVLGKNHEVISSASGEGKRNFMFTGQADDKCNLALRTVVGDVSERALSRISR